MAQPSALTGRVAGALAVPEVLDRLRTTHGGLSSAEAARRRAVVGPNALRTHHAQAFLVLVRQLRSPLLLLLAVTAVASFFVGERTDAVIIGAILFASVGLGFVNEFRAERAAEALHDQMRHHTLVIRDGASVSVDVVDLVPGDVVILRLGAVVPADLRLLAADDLECSESVLTGEGLPVTKTVEPVSAESGLAELTSCAWMGTVVAAGVGRGVVVATGGRTEFGRIAVGLGQRQPETEFQRGLRRFSMLLVKVAAVLTVGIFAVNLALHRPILDALLFSLAIAVGISPQLLPAVVSTSLASGSRLLARRKVLVKRLVCIEDLGDIEILFTDKTGTLTEGRIEFMRALAPDGAQVQLLGMVCCDIPDGNPLDAALWSAPGAPVAEARRYTKAGVLPFDHDRRLVSVLTDQGLLITKGAPEAVLSRCAAVPPEALDQLQHEFEAGHRVIAVATRDGVPELGPDAERGLSLQGFLVFSDPPKTTARAALGELARLGIAVKVITGDNPAVAARVCADLGLPAGDVLTGPDLDALDDEHLDEVVARTTIFARVDPEQKARIVRAQRHAGLDVAFLGDGVNDALALHAADVGIAVDSGADVAKDAADVVLLEKDLQVLADGVSQGRRVFANTVKYVLMGTSSNFGNMFSAAGASAFLSFLPMLPSQILLNNLLYDSSQLAIPTDTVDAEQLARPSRWDIGLIRRFMLVFGPISSLFDFATFFVMLQLFHAGPALFRTGWFVESLATQTLVLFVIRTRRSPFTRSRPSVPLLLAALTVVAVGALLPATPLAGDLGFTALPGGFFLTLLAMVIAYLALVELGKRRFFRATAPAPTSRPHPPGHRIHRRAARFSTTP
ncbi:magnesium-translocating P-type ATPase [Kribbella solani]|uniref:Magnesium-transporting ATPase, P-type 1 n=1 Tax=Kribbella solani TaxID=236067 RepID=A0A841DNW0_9ACTN|nr:Mg2+-importing ATPase [Kribbella solani]